MFTTTATLHGRGTLAVIADKNDTCQGETLRNRRKKYVKVCMYLCTYTIREVILEKIKFRESAKF